MRMSRVASAVIVLAALGGSTGAFAANICNETVPANRFIDGFPAYAQCAGASGGSIYSNNGIDTSTTNPGTGWVRTQGSGGYQCTELAHRYLRFRWNVTSVPNGNAGVWCDGAIPNGLMKVTTPVHGDLIVLGPGSCGADGTTGHVAVIDVVNADSTVAAVQQNSASRGRYNFSCAACFLHVIANDGTTPDAGAPVDAGAPTDAGAAPNDAMAGADSSSTRDAGTGGSAGPTGTGGSAGPAGTGGAAGPAGPGGSAGPAGTGGAAGPAGTGGAAGGPSVGPGAMPSDVGTGCACALENGQGGGVGLGLVLLLGVLAVGRGRRRHCRPS